MENLTDTPDDVRECPKCHVFRGIDEYGTQWYCAYCRRAYRKLRYHRRTPVHHSTTSGVKTCPICLENFPRSALHGSGYCPDCWNTYNNYRRRLLHSIGREATIARNLADELRMYARLGKKPVINLVSLRPIS